MNYNNYLEKIKNERKFQGRESGDEGQEEANDANDPGVDHFDPVAFYSSTEDASKSLAIPLARNGPSSVASGLNLRRSGRPKPAAEALISSPPAIKFYESTVIRSKPGSSSTSKARKKTLPSSSNPANEAINAVTTEASILKLRLPMSNSQASSKENISDKRNLRVVKLMMPDVTSEETDYPPGTGGKRPKSLKPLSAKSAVPAPVVEGEPGDSVQEIVNEDLCSSCGGLGNFICCDACPRSFHFTCAEPPLDPLNLPESDWFCCECRHQRQRQPQVDAADIWGLMLREAGRMNPTCFVMPRRFRYQPKEEDLQKLLSGQMISHNKSTESSQRPGESPPQVSVTQPPTHPPSVIVVNETIKLDHCSLKTPNISSLKSAQGYCHCCGRYGLTRSALQKSSEDPSIPCDLRLQRPILSCNICPLYWHLDCLDPPLPSFPANAEVGWTCPIHFTAEKCLALELVEALVQATLLLPEAAIIRQFEQKIRRRRDSLLVEKEAEAEEEEEAFYGISGTGVIVPDVIKQLYKE